jgi:hypothetical protein
MSKRSKKINLSHPTVVPEKSKWEIYFGIGQVGVQILLFRATFGLMWITYMLARSTEDMAKSTREMAETTRTDFIYRFTPKIMIDEPVLDETEGKCKVRMCIANQSVQGEGKDATHLIFYYTKEKRYLLEGSIITTSDGIATNLMTTPVDYLPQTRRWVSLTFKKDFFKEIEDVIVLVRYNTPFDNTSRFAKIVFHKERDGKHFDQVAPDTTNHHLLQIKQAGLLPSDCQQIIKAVEFPQIAP